MTESRCCRTYRCRTCGKIAAELSTSWSTVTVPGTGRTTWGTTASDAVHWHTCLECRSASPS